MGHVRPPTPTVVICAAAMWLTSCSPVGMCSHGWRRACQLLKPVGSAQLLLHGRSYDAPGVTASK